jgi:hypothetical protein
VTYIVWKMMEIRPFATTGIFMPSSRLEPRPYRYLNHSTALSRLHSLIGLSDLSRDIPDCRQVCQIVIHAHRILGPEAPPTAP